MYLEACYTGGEVVYKPVRTEMGGEVATTTLPVLVTLVGVREGTLGITLLAQCQPQGQQQESKQHCFPQPSNPSISKGPTGCIKTLDTYVGVPATCKISVFPVTGVALCYGRPVLR